VLNRPMLGAILADTTVKMKFVGHDDCFLGDVRRDP
jgi:hypothetical protein